MEPITRDAETMHGQPVFRGTRVPVQTLFDYLEGGEMLDEFLEGFPTVSRDLAVAALGEARLLLLARASGRFFGTSASISGSGSSSGT